jgi:transposase InsO family protein
MTYVLTTAKLDATGHRWLAALAAFNFNILSRPGKKNGDADGPSRTPQTYPDNRKTISIESVQAICNSILPKAYIESLAVNPDIVPSIAEDTQDDDIIDWVKAQAMDPVIKPFIKYVRERRKPTAADVGTTPLLRQFSHLRLVDDVLYREVIIGKDRKRQLVLPTAHIQTILEALHDDMGHPGKDRMLSLIRDRFYWPGMDKAVEEWISQCGRCIRPKTPASSQRAPLVSISTQFPLELACIDFLTLEQSKGGHHHILVITDHFTRYAHAIPTRNQTAKTTAQTIFDNFIVHYGIHQWIHSDQGANFESKVAKELCALTGMKKSRTTSYHPMENGMCERFNRTLLGMLGTMVHADNCTRHESTGVSPYFLMFGRHPRLPIDLAFGINKDSKQPVGSYVKNLRDSSTHAYQLATEASRNAQVRQKEGYDIKGRGATIQKGHRPSEASFL